MVKLGQTVKDRLTGFAGVVTARVEYLTGCAQVCVQPGMKADGDFREARYFDETRIEVTDATPIVIEGASTTDGADSPPPPIK